jgi:glycosyltransferase involved in cell wall biosynthesis
MPNLLVVSRYSDALFESADYVFVHHQIAGLKRFFDEITVISPIPWFPAWLQPVGRVWEKLRLRMLRRDYDDDNVHVRFAPFLPWVGRVPGSDRTRGLLPAVRRAIRRHDVNFDLVHSHMALQFGWHGAVVAQEHGVPSVLTVHDNHDGLIPVLRARRWDAMAALCQNDALIRVNPNDIDEIRELSGTDRPIHYIPNGFDSEQLSTCSRQQERQRLGLSEQRKVFVSVARWVERKDPLILLESLRRIDADVRPLLCMLGEDCSGGRIASRIVELGLEGDVKLCGQRSPEVVLQYMRASDAVILYSHSEGNPTVMFEALGCGRPYIGSEVGGVNAVIVDPRLGLYGPPKDPARLTELMQQALRTQWDEDFIREQARQYTWENIARRIHDEVFAPLLAARSR